MAATFREPIHIIGAGSIGLLFAASIRSKIPTYPVTLLLRGGNRNQQQRQPQDNGPERRMEILWKRPTYDPRIIAVKSSTTSARMATKVSVPVQFIENNQKSQQKQDDADDESIQNLLVTTKSYQASDAVQSVLGRMKCYHHSSSSSSKSSNNCRIVILCNGALSVLEELQSMLSSSSEDHLIVNPTIVLATTTHGAYREQLPPHQHHHNNGTLQRQVYHAGYGKTYIEEIPNGGNAMGNLWNEVGLECTVLSSQQMKLLLWNKLAANCVINPLTALYQCTNGQLLLEPSFTESQQHILQEIVQVSAAIVAAATNSDKQQQQYQERSPNIDELRNFVHQVILDTRDNKSSMYQDVVKKQRTEIEHLNGYVVRKGNEFGLSCPFNEDLCHQIMEFHAA